MGELEQRIAELEDRDVENRASLVSLGEHLTTAIRLLHDNDSEAEGRLAVLEAVTTALLARSDEATQRYALSAVQVALEVYADPEGPLPKNPAFLASFRQQAAQLFPDAVWTE